MIEFFREKDLNTVTGQWTKEKTSSNPWFAKVVPNFRSVPKTELPSGMDRATTFKSVCINTAIYLPWLASQCLRHGVILRRASVDHVTDAASLHHSAMRADVVVNCVGLAASKLGGVADKNVIPARGQTVLVRNEPGMMYGISGTDDGSDEVSYIMQRAAGKQSSPTLFARDADDAQGAARFWVVATRKTTGTPRSTPISPFAS